MFFGTIGFEAATGGIELRGMRMAVLNVAAPLQSDLPRARDPGITTPRATEKCLSLVHAGGDAGEGARCRETRIRDRGRTGRPARSASIEAPHPDLALSSIACLRQWRFSPPLKDGVPIAVVATMELAFKLK